MVDYERAVLDQVNDLSTNQMNGPMMIALNELKRRISADREYIWIPIKLLCDNSLFDIFVAKVHRSWLQDYRTYDSLKII